MYRYVRFECPVQFPHGQNGWNNPMSAGYTGSSTSQTETVNANGETEITTTYYYTLENDSVAGNTDSKLGSKVEANTALPKTIAAETSGAAGKQKSATSSQAVTNIANLMSTVQNTAANKNTG